MAWRSRCPGAGAPGQAGPSWAHYQIGSEASPVAAAGLETSTDLRIPVPGPGLDHQPCQGALGTLHPCGTRDVAIAAAAADGAVHAPDDHVLEDVLGCQPCWAAAGRAHGPVTLAVATVAAAAAAAVGLGKTNGSHVPALAKAPNWQSPCRRAAGSVHGPAGPLRGPIAAAAGGLGLGRTTGPHSPVNAPRRRACRTAAGSVHALESPADPIAAVVAAGSCHALVNAPGCQTCQSAAGGGPVSWADPIAADAVGDHGPEGAPGFRGLANAAAAGSVGCRPAAAAWRRGSGYTLGCHPRKLHCLEYCSGPIAGEAAGCRWACPHSAADLQIGEDPRGRQSCLVLSCLVLSCPVLCSCFVPNTLPVVLCESFSRALAQAAHAQHLTALKVFQGSTPFISISSGCQGSLIGIA